jgi:hypothetical protein
MAFRTGIYNAKNPEMKPCSKLMLSNRWFLYSSLLKGSMKLGVFAGLQADKFILEGESLI